MILYIAILYNILLRHCKLNIMTWDIEKYLSYLSHLLLIDTNINITIIDI